MSSCQKVGDEKVTLSGKSHPSTRKEGLKKERTVEEWEKKTLGLTGGEGKATRAENNVEKNHL